MRDHIVVVDVASAAFHELAVEVTGEHAVADTRRTERADARGA
jgi:hypothetical protein